MGEERKGRQGEGAGEGGPYLAPTAAGPQLGAVHGSPHSPSPQPLHRKRSHYLSSMRRKLRPREIKQLWAGRTSSREAMLDWRQYCRTPQLQLLASPSCNRLGRRPEGNVRGAHREEQGMDGGMLRPSTGPPKRFLLAGLLGKGWGTVQADVA